MEAAFQDPFGRQITYVRVSVTDRCNLKCVYCIPDGMEWVEKAARQNDPDADGTAP